MAGRKRPAHARRGAQAHGDGLAKFARSRWARIGLPALCVLFALVAVGAFAFPALSDLYANQRQHALAAQLDDPALGNQVAAVGDGKPIGRILIPAIGLNMVLVQGTDTSDLEEGPGHYPGSPMPCTVGDVAIAGHRTTYLHPFYNLNELSPGDLVELETPTSSCDYAVSQPPFAVLPTDVSVVDDTPGLYTITLTTCTPRGSASHRLVVKGVLLPGSLRATKSLGAPEPLRER